MAPCSKLVLLEYLYLVIYIHSHFPNFSLGSSAFSFSPAGAPGMDKATGMRRRDVSGMTPGSAGYPGDQSSQQVSSEAMDASSSGYGFQKKHLQPQYIEEPSSVSDFDDNDLEDFDSNGQAIKYVNGGLGFRQTSAVRAPYPARAATGLGVFFVQPHTFTPAKKYNTIML